jgi:hypothetical protein
LRWKKARISSSTPWVCIANGFGDFGNHLANLRESWASTPTSSCDIDELANNLGKIQISNKFFLFLPSLQIYKMHCNVFDVHLVPFFQILWDLDFRLGGCRIRVIDGLCFEFFGR